MFKKIILISLMVVTLALHIVNGAAVQVQPPGEQQPNQVNNRLSFGGRDSLSPSYSPDSRSSPNGGVLSQRNGYPDTQSSQFGPGSRYPPSNQGGFYPSYYIQPPYQQAAPLFNQNPYGGYGGFGYAPNSIPSYGNPSYYAPSAYGPQSAAGMSAYGNIQSQQYQPPHLQQQQQQQAHFPSYYRSGMGVQGLKSEAEKKASQ